MVKKLEQVAHVPDNDGEARRADFYEDCRALQKELSKKAKQKLLILFLRQQESGDKLSPPSAFREEYPLKSQ